MNTAIDLFRFVNAHKQSYQIALEEIIQSLEEAGQHED